MLFSERMNYINTKTIQLESIDNETRNRIYNVILNFFYEINKYDKFRYTIQKDLYRICADKFFKIPNNQDFHNYINKIEKLILKGEWHRLYSFIEFLCPFGNFLNEQTNYNFEKSINTVLKEEVTGYQLINSIITPITNNEEIESLELALNSKYDSVNQHMNKALIHFSNKINPDYNNSIKESISAVESIACIITKKNNATLASALDRLKNKGVKIHQAQINAFKQLYGYTSDENGIRHAGIDFSSANNEDAKFMLISCSAFVNYLIIKYENSNGYL